MSITQVSVKEEEPLVEPPIPALSISGVTVNLGGRRVLTDVSMDIQKGELVGLLGPNGAGKTTLLRAILGLVPSESGTVHVAGEKVSARRRPIGYVPQRHEFVWDFPLSVEEAVLSGLTGKIGWFRKPGVEHYRAAARALDRVGLKDLATRPVGELSGGQRQRVLVARALALASPLLLLDEPFTGLDMPTQELLMELFTDLAREGHAVVMTTHDILGALHSADRLYLLQGTVRASGPASALRDRTIWMDTFGVSANNPLLSAVGVTHA